jgi:hypothetical protein
MRRLILLLAFALALALPLTCSADPGTRKETKVERAERKALRRLERKAVYSRPKAGRIVVIAAFAILSGAVVTNYEIK